MLHSIGIGLFLMFVGCVFGMLFATRNVEPIVVVETLHVCEVNP